MINLDGIGDPIAFVASGKMLGKMLCVSRDDEDYTVPTGKKSRRADEINLRSDKLLPLVNENRREVYYIAGPSGSGKSTYSRELIKSFKLSYPDNKIVIFCRTSVENDPAYEDLEMKEVVLDETLIDYPIDIENDIEEGTLIVFDDTSTVNDKNINKAIVDLQKDLMECGRKMDLYMIITNHLVNPNNRGLGRVILNEMSAFTFFPKAGGFYQIKYCLKNYFGLSKKQIEHVMKLPSRWVTIFKSYPQVVLHQHGAYVVD